MNRTGREGEGTRTFLSAYSNTSFVTASHHIYLFVKSTSSQCHVEVNANAISNDIKEEKHILGFNCIVYVLHCSKDHVHYSNY